MRKALLLGIFVLSLGCGNLSAASDHMLKPHLWPLSIGRESAVSPDGGTLAIASRDGNIRVFGFNGRGVTMTVIKGNPDGSSALAFSADSKQLASLGNYGGLQIRALANPYKITEIPLTGLERSWRMVFSRSGKSLAVVGDKQAVVYETSTGKQVRRFSFKDSCSDIAFTEGDTRLVSSSRDREIAVWDIKTGAEIKKWKSEGFRSAIAPGAGSVAYGYGKLKLLNLANGAVRELEPEQKGSIEQLAFSGDGKLLAICREYGIVQIWDIRTGAQLSSFSWVEDKPYGQFAEGYEARSARGIYFVQGGRNLAVLPGLGPVELWDVRSGKRIKTLKQNTAGIVSLAAIGARKLLLSGDSNGTARLWDLGKGTLASKWTLPYMDFVQLAVSDDERNFFYSDSRGDHLVVYDLETLKPVIEFTAKVYDNGKHSVFSKDKKCAAVASFINRNGRQMLLACASKEQPGPTPIPLDGALFCEACQDFSPDNNYLAYARNDNSIRIIKTRDGSDAKVLTGNTFVPVIAYSNDGKYLIGISMGARATIWDTSTWKEVMHLNGFVESYNSLVAAVGGKYLINGQDKILRMTDKVDKEGRVVPGHWEWPGRGASTADNKLIALVGKGGVPVILDASTLEQKSRLPAFGASVGGLSFFGTGKFLAIGGANGLISVRNVETGKEASSLVAFLDDEWAIFSPDGHYKASAGGGKYLTIDGVTDSALIKKYRTEYVSAAAVEESLSDIFR